MIPVVLRSAPFRLALVLATVTLFQLSVMAEFRIFGVTGDLVLLFSLAAGLVAGPERGALAAFALGIANDLVVTTPFGLTPLSYSVAAYFVAGLQAALRPGRAQVAVTMFLASAGAIGLWVTLASLFGRPDLFTTHLVRIVLVVATLNVVLAPFALRTVRWVFAVSLSGVRRAA